MQARSQEVRPGGGGGDRLILLKAFIRGPKYESGGGGPNTRAVGGGEGSPSGPPRV